MGIDCVETDCLVIGAGAVGLEVVWPSHSVEAIRSASARCRARAPSSPPRPMPLRATHLER